MSVSEHPPVRLIVDDDSLERERITVFFRWLLAIPHFFWLGLWGIVAFFAAIVNWLATLVLGRSPQALHGFLARYVKYTTQFFAYFYLAAEPYPPFSGKPGYVVDVRILEPTRQNRLGVAFRGILFLPAVLLASALLGDRLTSGLGGGSSSYAFGLLHVAAFLGWFACLARARMPRGLRDLVDYTLSYGAQFWCYAFLLTDRYPNSDPNAAASSLPVREDPIGLELGDEDERRSRLTVFFRLLLAIPHFVWLLLWSLVVFFAAIANWLVTLFRGRSPEGLHRFLARYLRYEMHVYAFLYLIANPFPGFVGAPDTYPLEVNIAPPARQNLWKTGFRLILAFPAGLLASAFGALLSVAAFLGWFAALATAKMPHGLRNAGALALRYHAQTIGYLLLLTDAYPYSGPTTLGASAPNAGTDAITPQPPHDAPPTPPAPPDAPTFG